MSDRGIPATYRHMHGFGSHTSSFINAKNERYWVKFHFRSQPGIENLTAAEAEAIVGKDPPYWQFLKADSAYGAGVAKALGVSLREVPK